MTEESKIICKKIIESDLFKNAGTILTYMPLPSEVDVSEVTDTAVKMQKNVFIPKVYADENLPVMKFHRFSKESKTTSGRFGILEPDEKSQTFSLAEVSDDKNKNILILVPGLAFTKEGKRLGRGKGYYDYFLNELYREIEQKKGCRVFAAGVCFSFQLLQDIPVQKHDISVDFIFAG